MQRDRNSNSLVTGMQNHTATLQESLTVSTKLNILLSYNPAVMLLAVYPNELQTQVETKTCTLKFIAALFIIAET